MNLNHEIVVVGGGLAGLSLARHLLLETNFKITLVERKDSIPGKRHKVGESLVQIGGYYFAKFLQMEEHLLHKHFMKYNLRFYFKNHGFECDKIEDYSQAYIRNFSNIPCYQLDRNVFEAELLKENLNNPRFSIVIGAKVTSVQINENDIPNLIRFENAEGTREIECRWLVDTTGRNRLLARKLDSRSASPIKHGAAFMWVDGIVDIEKLTSLPPNEQRMNPDRQFTGHLPFWLATNHFMGEGFWLWTIPLKGKTSIGLVYDSARIDGSEVNSSEKLTQWICDEFPLFADDLGSREVLDFGAYKDFAYDCGETISPNRWAMSGMSGRFQDPLYSPGSDFIAFHNALIVDAIRTDLQDKRGSSINRELKRKCWLYELTLQSIYRSLLPSYATSYDALGDQETFVLKYTWELSVYFSFLTFPWVCNLQSDTNFIPGYLSRFSRLGEINQGLQKLISVYFQWKKANRQSTDQTVFHDFTELEPLKVAESCFYKVDCDAEQALRELDQQLENLEELARFTIAHIVSSMAGIDDLVYSRAFVERIDFRNLNADLESMIEAASDCVAEDDSCRYEWRFDPGVLQKFRNQTLGGKRPNSRLSASKKMVPTFSS